MGFPWSVTYVKIDDKHILIFKCILNKMLTKDKLWKLTAEKSIRKINLRKISITNYKNLVTYATYTT